MRRIATRLLAIALTVALPGWGSESFALANVSPSADPDVAFINSLAPEFAPGPDCRHSDYWYACLYTTKTPLAEPYPVKIMVAHEQFREDRNIKIGTGGDVLSTSEGERVVQDLLARSGVDDAHAVTATVADFYQYVRSAPANAPLKEMKLWYSSGRGLSKSQEFKGSDGSTVALTVSCLLGVVTDPRTNCLVQLEKFKHP